MVGHRQKIIKKPKKQLREKEKGTREAPSGAGYLGKSGEGTRSKDPLQAKFGGEVIEVEKNGNPGKGGVSSSSRSIGPRTAELGPAKGKTVGLSIR